VVADDVPDDVVVDPDVVVNQSISHAGHRPPVHVRVPGPELRRYLLRCLTDDLEAADEGSTEGLVVAKGVERQIAAVGQQILCLRQYVADVLTRL